MPLLNRINYNFFPGFLLNLCVCERLFVCMIFQRKNDEGMRVCVCYQLYFNILPFVICIFQPWRLSNDYKLYNAKYLLEGCLLCVCVFTPFAPFIPFHSISSHFLFDSLCFLVVLLSPKRKTCFSLDEQSEWKYRCVCCLLCTKRNYLHILTIDTFRPTTRANIKLILKCWPNVLRFKRTEKHLPQSHGLPSVELYIYCVAVDGCRVVTVESMQMEEWMHHLTITICKW